MADCDGCEGLGGGPGRDQTAFATLPALMQDAQTCIRLRLPLTRVWTVWMFGSHRRFVRRCEWLSCFEKYGDFPQISQVADMEVMVPVPALGAPQGAGKKRARS